MDIYGQEFEKREFFLFGRETNKSNDKSDHCWGILHFMRYNACRRTCDTVNRNVGGGGGGAVTSTAINKLCLKDRTACFKKNQINKKKAQEEISVWRQWTDCGIQRTINTINGNRCGQDTQQGD